MCAKLLIHAEMGSVVAASEDVNLGVRRRGRMEGWEPPLWYVWAATKRPTRAVASRRPTALATALLDCKHRSYDRVYDFVDCEVGRVHDRIGRIVRKR